MSSYIKYVNQRAILELESIKIEMERTNKMKLYAVSVCHMKPEIVAYSLARARITNSIEPTGWVIVDNCWPIDSENTSAELMDQANIGMDQAIFGSNGEVGFNDKYYYVKAPKNLGGIGGFNFGLSKLDLQDDDLVLGYDPDSNPITKDWLLAMKEVMLADTSLTHLSLLHEHIVNRAWIRREVAGYKLVSLPHPEMFNVTIWRGSYLKSGAVKQGRPYYGFVETETKGGRHAYLYDYREDLCPIPHDPRYNRWKHDHAVGNYPGNFDQYILEGRGV